MFQVGRRARPPPSPLRSLPELNASARQVCYRVSCQERASGLLRSTADNTLAHIVLLLFSRVHDRLPRGAPGAPGAPPPALPRAAGEDDTEWGDNVDGEGSSRPSARSSDPVAGAPSPPPSGTTLGPTPIRATGGPNEVSVLVNVMRFLVRSAPPIPHRALPLGAPTSSRAVSAASGAPRRPSGPGGADDGARALAHQHCARGGRRGARRVATARQHPPGRAVQASAAQLSDRRTDHPLAHAPRRVQPVLLDQGPPQSPARSLPHVGPPPNRRRRLGGQGRPVRVHARGRARGRRGPRPLDVLSRGALSRRALARRALSLFRASPRFPAR